MPRTARDRRFRRTVSCPLTNAELAAEVTGWERFVWKEVGRWKRAYPDVDLEDLHAAALMGFVEARRLFNRDGGIQFISFAGHYLRKNFQQLVQKESAKGLHYPHPQKIVQAPVQSLQAVATGGECDRAWEPADDRAGAPVYPADWWRVALRGLDTRLALVLLLRFRDGVGLRQVGEIIGVTRERVRQLEAKGLLWLRKHRKDLADELA